MRKTVDEKNPFLINSLRASKPSFPRPSPMGRYGVDDPGQNDRENLWDKDLFQNHSVRPQELWPIHHSIIIMMIIHHVSIEYIRKYDDIFTMYPLKLHLSAIDPLTMVAQVAAKVH